MMQPQAAVWARTETDLIMEQELPTPT